jgi:mono/diheme cytochrome c family protein
MRNFLLGILFALAALLVGGYGCLKSGCVNLRADQRPSSFEQRLAMSAVDAWLDRHSAAQKNPLPPTEENLVEGAKLYVDHCAGCHGVPSNADSRFADSFYPPVPSFFKDPPEMGEDQNFYVIVHGIRWTGMPAWRQVLTDDQVWHVVIFLSKIQRLPPAALKLFGIPKAPGLVPGPMHVVR